MVWPTIHAIASVVRGSIFALAPRMQLMFDRLLNSALWLVIMGMISLASAFSLILAYRGTLNLCIGKYPSGAMAILVGTLLGAASFLLCRHSNDLIDR